MISIDQIGREGNYWYHFPTIDFKFQNAGAATAFLWQFAINILRAEIDPTPVLSFKAKVTYDNELQVVAVNNGWGAAYDCHMQIDEPSLNRLFTESIRQSKGIIHINSEPEILHLTKEMAIPSQFEAISKEFVEISPWRVFGIKLQTPRVTWRCKDHKGAKHKGEASVIHEHGDDMYITQKGFEVGPVQGRGAGVPSDVTYITLLNPLEGAHERIYPISRKIPPGDVERFHIMIGSSMSCHLLARFKFFVDQATVIESEAFKIEIWNPMDSRWHWHYRDGEELYMSQQIKRQVSDYPFIRRQ